MLRPWIADDGALVRLRLGGAPLRWLHDLIAIAEEWGDGAVYLTSRGNVQIRGIAHQEACVPDAFVAAVSGLGLLPAPTHELVRNIEISPLSGRAGGRADVRPLATELDALVCTEARLAQLPGRFLFVLDDGRGDVAWRPLDLGLIAVDSRTAQLRAGTRVWGELVPLDTAAARLVDLARRFVDARGSGPLAPWHVDELPVDLMRAQPRDPRTQVVAEPWPFGMIEQRDGRLARHLEVPGGRLTRTGASGLPDTVIVTPWRSLIVPDLESLA